MTRKRAVIIYNSMSGKPGRRAADADEMIRLLAERGIDAEARATSGPQDATTLAREAVAAASDIVISYGGDGTLNEVIQEMAGTSAALAVWPGGTANVVARDLGMPSDVAKLADVIGAGRTKRIALGVAEGNGAAEAGSPSSRVSVRVKRRFMMMAGIGLDASIARGVNRRIKRRIGEFAYWLVGIKHLFTWDPEVFSVEVDGARYESVFTLVGKGSRYGGEMSMTPNARLEEPLFEVFILPRQANNFAYLRALAACRRGAPELSGAVLVKGRQVKANSAEEPWVQVDGELIGPLPMNFNVEPDALSVIVP